MTYKVLKSFQAKTGGKLIKFKEDQSISIPEEKARGLIEAGKIRPPEATPKQFEDCFKDAVTELSKDYPQGLIDHIRQKHPERWERSIQAENRINRIWDDCKDLAAFQKAVSEWREIELGLVKLFKNK
ncbi:MAG: hypothetical protein JETT_2872 [Candidatus Jettenia ecosi]|uniref:Uncharacterized protein n=1 Tax=Candidatus Jettenia ecosi TaxID=2494326 RepID=A0A533QJY5_9BACT|nr:MAG: hypothetical protein JETT_2872 [Candidatus Jettenia ecosi]